MKQLQKSDLKKGEIYWFVGNNIKFLNKISTTNINRYSNYLYNNTYFNIEGSTLYDPVSILETTEEEKHWLETCIKADKFVSYEEAMKTFIPEYVECVQQLIGSCYKLGIIYKVNDNGFIKNDSYSFAHYNYNQNRFKPSTKEAYDAQFVVKEPEFVLPEKWYVKDISKNEIDIVCEYGNKMWSTPNYNCKTWKPTMLRKILIGNYSSGRPYFVDNDFSHNHTEITFDQFKQYVLKENTTVTEEPKIVLEEPKDKALAHLIQSGKTTIQSVECSEGGVYRIGDKIRVFGGSKNPVFRNKQYFTIQSFRWSNDKSKICAVTELHTPNGIGLDKIELYVEPKVKQELSLLEQAKLKYPIGTKFKCIYQRKDSKDQIYVVTQEVSLTQSGDIYVETNIPNGKFKNVYDNYNHKWAEIVDDFVLPEKWCIKQNTAKEVCDWFNKNGTNTANINGSWTYLNYPNIFGYYSNKIDPGFTEITFEQFKKYVLKNE